MRTKGIFLKSVFLLVIILIFINLSSAINLEIEKKAVTDVVIKELDNNAIFKFTIKNLGETDDFEIYSFVVDILPRGMFNIVSGQTKEIEVKIKAGESVKKNSGYFNFVYKIKGSKTGIQEDRLTIKIINLKDSFELTADSINPDSKTTTVYLQNKENFNFEDVEAEFSSVFFNFKKNFSLSALEKKSFTVDLDKESFKKLMAGPYLLNTNIKIENAKETLESTIKFLEKSGLVTSETKEGILLSRYEVEKRNEGNLITLAEINVRKDIISRLFTTFNILPEKVERKGFFVSYYWQKELRPGESLNVVARTNWLLPIIILVAVLLILLLTQIYLTSDVILRKRISYVKTKGGEFALKVSINIKARRFAEKIEVLDKLPPVVKLYERYGTIAPDKIDIKNKRLGWNIENLNAGGEIILSYIIYSKIGVVGKFELPAATAVYEREGKIKETSSNKVFFVNEPNKPKED